MSDLTEDVAASEIIIVRRRNREDEDGHGSTAWKIAFADFMTAMMALFLVLWLTHATDADTKKQVASYFSPIKLTDKIVLRKGVKTDDGEVSITDPDESGNNNSNTKARHSDTSKKSEGGEADEASFKDTSDLVKRLAAQASVNGFGSVKETSDLLSDGAVLEKGSAYRDPFNPAFRSEVVSLDVDINKENTALEHSNTDAVDEETAASLGISNLSMTGAAGQIEQRDKSNGGKHDSRDRVRERAKRLVKDAARLRGAIIQAVEEVGAGPSIEVTIDKEGLLISLIDNSNFGMFSVASANPSAQLVSLMGRVGNILHGRKESIVIRGHTDGRPFRTADNDNWLLSMARAHMAYSMLVGAGVDESRFEKIESYADRLLRVARDPEASQNRRIEILLREGVL